MSRPSDNPLEVTNVENLPRDPLLLGCFLGIPKAADELEDRELVLRGWVLPAEAPASAVEVTVRETVIARVTVEKPRPDILAAFPEADHAQNCGFEFDLGLNAVHTDLELGVRAAIGPLRRLEIAKIAIAHKQVDNTPTVAVVIPCFNQAHFLGDAIESVLAQTHSEIEVIVVDDGSRDNTVAVAGRYPGVRYIRQENQGLAAARNTGLEQVEADFVVFLDSDDRLLPGAMERGLRELEAHPEAVMAAGAWQLIGEDGQPLPSSPVMQPEHVFEGLLESCFISSPAAVIYRRELFGEIGGFDPEVSASADYDLYLRAAARHPVRLHGGVVAEYRRHGANMTRNSELIVRSELEVLGRRRPLVEGQPRLREALDRGIERSRSYHGARMVDEVRRQVDAGQRGDALRTVASVERLYPAGIPEARRALERESLR